MNNEENNHENVSGEELPPLTSEELESAALTALFRTDDLAEIVYALAGALGVESNACLGHLPLAIEERGSVASRLLRIESRLDGLMALSVELTARIDNLQIRSEGK